MKDKKLPKLVYKTKRTVSRSLDVFSDILTPTKDNLGIIPKSGVVVSVMKALLSAHKYFLIRSVSKFQRAFDDMPEDVKERLIERLKDEPSFKERVARILMDLPLLDDGEKVNWLVNFMKAYTVDLIDSYKLDCFRYTLRNSLVQDLKLLIEIVEAKEKDPKYNWVGHFDELALQRLASAGLLTGPITADSPVFLNVNEYVKSFVKFGMGEKK